MQPKTKTVLFIFLSFLMGILLGWFIENELSPRAPHMTGDFEKMLIDRLHLSHNQIGQVDSILDYRRQQVEVYKRQILTIRDSAQAEIRKVLNADQNRTFEEIVKEINEREAKRKESTPPKK